MMWHPMGISALITLVVIALWATSRLPEYLVALLFFATVMILQLAPAGVVFSGFASSAFWLVLSGFVLGAAIRATGLADRLANRLLPYLASSWLRLVGGVVAISYALAFVMPSNMGRITLLMPIIMVLAERAGLAAGSRGRIGLALAVGFGTFQLSASILPANMPNLVMSGAAESTFGIHFTYIAYLLLHAPILGVAKGVLLTLCICWLFRATPQKVEKISGQVALSMAEWRLIILLFTTVLLWITDSWHGIAPAWVGLAAACFCLLPRVGFLTGEQFAAGVNIRTCIYIAGILGLTALVSHSGLGNWLGDALVKVMPQNPDRPFIAFASLIGITALLNFVVTANGVPALFTPLAQILADSSGLPLITVLMTQVIGYATPLLPYQASPIVVAMGMGNVPLREGLKLCLLLAALSFGLLVPLDYLWFRLLGWMG
ncbi:citrate transporter [Chania multitudinisentens RB-25]|uniref:Citrate transporter n=2 Tax=Chania TaxID=1745211 RepID=W0LHD0_9GAMM|nr:SLC13 family permease [Chania multitudinisentens]AHG21717.2 citrate transporter [Chania multitudinisentens RB-25]